VSSFSGEHYTVIEAAQYETKTNFREFSRLCAKAFREERKKILETEVLSDYDIDSYKEYLAMKLSDRKFYDAISEKIGEAENEWSLLFAGFDDLDEPHIFVVTGKGKIQYCDPIGFACIGSGGWSAYSSLSAHPYNINLYPGEAIYSLLVAKFCAEPAHGVGDTTAFLTIRPTDRLNQSVSGLMPQTIEALREKWKSMPKVPPGVVDELTTDSRVSAMPMFRLAVPKRKRHRKKKS